MASYFPSKNSTRKATFTYGSSSSQPKHRPSRTARDSAASCSISQQKTQSSTSHNATDFSPGIEKPWIGAEQTASTGSAADQQSPKKKRRKPSATIIGKSAVSRERESLANPTKTTDTTPRREPNSSSSLLDVGHSSKTTVESTRSRTSQTPPRERDKSQSSSRKRRLIDALAAQRDRSPDTGSLYNGERECDTDGDEAMSPFLRRIATTEEQRPRPVDRRELAPTGRKIILTYGQSRSAISESREAEDLAVIQTDSNDSAALAETQAPPSPIENAINDEDVEDDVNYQPAIKSVHELRRSGANHRNADELDDLLARIGIPSAGSLTMRRNALCELAQNLPREGFARQFRDHAYRDKIANCIGRENDVVCGFALAAALVIFLKSGPAPHLVRQLSRQGLGTLLGQLLHITEDIDTIAAKRRTNLSRTSLTSVRNVKSIIMRMPIWHGFEPLYLSPRILSLQLLETISRCSERQLLEQVAKDSEKDLISVAAECTAPAASSKAGDYAPAVFALEALSSGGVIVGSCDHETSRLQLLRSVSCYLRTAMRGWPCDHREFQAAVLKLAINTTNTQEGAVVFDDAELLSLLADCIGKGFTRVQDAIGNGSLEGDVYHELLLMLGVMINIVEHSPPARSSLKQASLDGLVSLWRQNRQAMTEADSVEKSKVSVAMSYLAVLLGYLCLTARGREHIKARVGDGDGFRSLLGSICDFVAINRAVDSKAHELEALVNELRRHSTQGRSV